MVGKRDVKKRGKLGLLSKIALIIAFVIVVVLGIGSFAWSVYGDKIADILGQNDYHGSGTEQVIVKVDEGDGAEAIATKLVDKDIVKTRKAFIKAAEENTNANFQPGSFKLKRSMSAASAVEALLDPANRDEFVVTIKEGATSHGAFEVLSKASGIPVQEFENAARNPQKLGVPAGFTTVEGYLFPATYRFDASSNATDILTTMVKRMDSAVVAHKIPANRLHDVLTLASIVQREAGGSKENYGKIARVFQNRLDRHIKLQSDATVVYGTGKYGTVWTSDEDRADKSNPYNTYANQGLPIGPIGLPGDSAIEAAMNPTPGDWIYFVTVNLETGETAFGSNDAEHNANVEKLQTWCKAHVAAGGKLCD